MASLLKGITVNLITKVQNGTDAFNRPIEQEVITPVDNVLVAPLSDESEEILSELSLNGKKAKLVLTFERIRCKE